MNGSDRADGTRVGRRELILAGLLGGLGLAATLTGCTGGNRDPGATSTRSEQTTMTGTSTSRGTTRPKVLMVYFSRAGENYWNGGRRTLSTGNTQALAQLVEQRIDCAVYRIRETDAYPSSYDQTVQRNVAEEQANARPDIAGSLPDLTGYDTVLLGCPVWNVRAPMIMLTFLDSVDLTGKTVLPFVTYAVSGIGTIEDDYRRALPNSTVRTGLAVRGETVDQAGAQVDAWLRAARLLA